MPVSFFNRSWYVEWYLTKKEISHVSVQNLKLCTSDRYVGGWSQANIRTYKMIIFGMRVFLRAVGLGMNKKIFKILFQPHVTEVLFQITTWGQINLCTFRMKNCFENSTFLSQSFCPKEDFGYSGFLHHVRGEKRVPIKSKFYDAPYSTRLDIFKNDIDIFTTFRHWHANVLLSTLLTFLKHNRYAVIRKKAPHGLFIHRRVAEVFQRGFVF